MHNARGRHIAVLLPNGEVLVAGGLLSPNDTLVAGAELYNPQTGQWSTTGSLNDARGVAIGALLPTGQVLVAGGAGTSYGVGTAYMATAELYNPQTGIWTRTASMNVARNTPAASLLPSGQVLVSGGINNTGNLTSAELYNPQTGTWTLTGSMNDARNGHTSTLLRSGQVLVAGGSPDGGYNGIVSAEVYTSLAASTQIAGLVRYEGLR
jgi:N-acetylneuraminic acid mutarotase